MLVLLHPSLCLQLWGLFNNNCFLELDWNFAPLPLVDEARLYSPLPGKVQ